MQKWVRMSVSAETFFLNSVVFVHSDDCRFPHVIPEGATSQPPSNFSGRSGQRPRAHANGNGIGTIEEKFAGMTVRDVCAILCLP
jgi:hypothetical protein